MAFPQTFTHIVIHVLTIHVSHALTIYVVYALTIHTYRVTYTNQFTSLQ